MKLGWVLASSLIVASPAVAGPNWSDVGTAVAGGLVATSFALPALHRDGKGALMAGASLGATYGATELLKATFPDKRPDGSDERAFPSEHTSISFAAAATLQNRYGWKVGVPAQIAAAFVGYTRVKAHKHQPDDVLVGAAIGEFWGFALTRKESDRVQVMPWGGTHSGGFAMSARF